MTSNKPIDVIVNTIIKPTDLLMQRTKSPPTIVNNNNNNNSSNNNNSINKSNNSINNSNNNSKNNNTKVIIEKKIDPYLEVSSWPYILQGNASILRKDEHELVRLMLGLKQNHIFDDWEKGGINDAKKHALFDQLKALNNPPGSLESYLERAKKLLKSSANGENPLDGWIPEVPSGITLGGPFSSNFKNYQKRGIIIIIII